MNPFALSSTPYSALPAPLLMANGLNMQAVFNIDDLPPAMRESLSGLGMGAPRYRQLLLFGHGGTAFWTRLQEAGMTGPDPVDAFSRQVVEQFLAEDLPGVLYRVAYPGMAAVPLQALGKLAGWHHDSPMKVGINDYWGLWYAYRAVVVADSRLPVSAPVKSVSPCLSCVDKPCVQACPAEALTQDDWRLQRCMDFRLQPASACAGTCVARLACPVAGEHRYSDSQMAYHYGVSLAHIVSWRNCKR